MPRKTGEQRLDDTLEALASALCAAKGPWMIIGGIAVIARGVRRMTTDIDVVIRGDAVELGKLIRVLARHAIRPRIEKAAEFAERNLVLLLRHAPTGVDLDLSLGWTDFERAAIASSTLAAFGRASYPMASADDLVVFKALAGRPKDIEDAATLLLMYPAVDLERVRHRLARLAELAEEPALVDGLDRVVAHARAVRKGSGMGASTTRTPARKRKPARGVRKNIAARPRKAR